MGAPSFDIPVRPERHFPGTGGVEYRGGTVFELSPATAEGDFDDQDLVEVVDEVLASGPYQFGDFHELPMPLWLVRDRETGDAFRVAVRGGDVQLHVLPRTEAPGLRAFYDRLVAATDDVDWRVAARRKD